MHATRLTIPEIALIAVTRAALGAGAGLLLSERLSRGQRQGAGWSLLALGLCSTVPLLLHVLSQRER